METTTIVADSITYFVSGHKIPTYNELPWRDGECDAFVAVLDAELLTDEVAGEVSLGLVGLRTDWIETMGRRAEFLHDLIDDTSVSVGRQSRVGQGCPMTAWHEYLAEMNGMIDYIRLGGQGASENKLVVVIGTDQSVHRFADKLKAVAMNN